jgi:DNA-binding MarR family transcriptional regulator
MTTKERILREFGINNELIIKEITERLGVSKRMVHMAINQLVCYRKIW